VKTWQAGVFETSETCQGFWLKTFHGLKHANLLGFKIA
jgi:hypothetical protein